MLIIHAKSANTFMGEINNIDYLFDMASGDGQGHHNLLPNMLHSHKQVTVAMLTPVHCQKHKQQAGKTQK